MHLSIHTLAITDITGYLLNYCNYSIDFRQIEIYGANHTGFMDSLLVMHNTLI